MNLPEVNLNRHRMIKCDVTDARLLTDDGVWFELRIHVLYSTLSILVVVTVRRTVAFLVAPSAFLHALRPGSKSDAYIVCMHAQPVRVIVRLPYNRPEHRQSDPVPVSFPDSLLF